LSIDAVDESISENDVGKIIYGGVPENAGGNDTVPISVRRVNSMRSTELYSIVG